MPPRTSIAVRWHEHAALPTITRAWRRIAGFAIAAPLLLLAGCASTVPATVTWGPWGAIHPDSKIYVRAARQSAAVDSAMRAAGFAPVKYAKDADYSLQVNIGSSRGSTACGTINNVAYILNMGPQRILVIKGRGPTGNCRSAVLGGLSDKLAAYFHKQS